MSEFEEQDLDGEEEDGAESSEERSLIDLDEEEWGDVLDRPTDEQLAERLQTIEDAAREKALAEVRARSDAMRAKYRGEGTAPDPYAEQAAEWESTKMAALSDADFAAFLRMREGGVDALGGRSTTDADLADLYRSTLPAPLEDD
jgi:hypothetical protein